MGPSGVPLLLRSLDRQPDHWFWALYAVTGEDPVSPEDKGDTRKMAAAWLEWGRKRGYLADVNKDRTELS